MQINKRIFVPILVAILYTGNAYTQNKALAQQAQKAMMAATKYMVDSVSTNGGYVWYYLPDFSRRWGEMEAYKTMIWVQDGGTVTVGDMLLDAYKATGDEYFYQAAKKAADAMIWGQNNEGGWNYMIDFAGDRSLKQWYATIGKNGWRLEEFQHYYGNSTYDDEVTSDAARFLLKLYLVKLDPEYKPALDKAINFILKSQYLNGGWPQRYPLKYDFNKAGHPDYTSFYTYNDNVIWENLYFLIQCYQTLGEERFLDPIRRGMDFYYISQQGNGAWGQQYNMQMEVAGARTYEPAAYLPRATLANSLLLLKFYHYTGDRKYLSRIPDAIRWLDNVKLPDSMTENGKYTHSLFVEVGTDKPIFVHRKGSNVKYGFYYTDYSDSNLLGHMHGKGNINVQYLKDEYARVSALSPEEATKDSPLLPGKFKGTGTPQTFYQLNRGNSMKRNPKETNVKEVIESLDNKNRWLIKHAMISNPYIGDGKNQEPTTKYSSTMVGDKTDTSPYRDTSDQEYISTSRYVQNMYLLINYLNSINNKNDR